MRRLPVLILNTQLAARRLGPVAMLAMLLSVAGSAAWLWYWPALQSQRALDARKVPAAATAQAAKPSADQNLLAFYEALGEQRYVEQQVKAIFAIAGKSGLVLASGQYKPGYEQNGRFHTYQVVLPVKGNYRTVWQFALQVLASVPFASLDEISFRRDSIGEPLVEARLRFTLYLKEGSRP